jgi:hypothetical protein
VESASAVSDAPSDASPSVLRESKKLCVRGCCLSLMSAAGGASSALIGDRLVLGREFAVADSATVAVVGASGSAVPANTLGFADAGTLKATVLLASEEAEVAIGAGVVVSDVAPVAATGAVESSVAAGVEAEAGVGEAGLGDEERGPRSSEANAGGPKNANKKSANIMAHAMADFTRPPCT